MNSKPKHHQFLHQSLIVFFPLNSIIKMNKSLLIQNRIQPTDITKLEVLHSILCLLTQNIKDVACWENNIIPRGNQIVISSRNTFSFMSWTAFCEKNLSTIINKKLIFVKHGYFCIWLVLCNKWNGGKIISKVLRTLFLKLDAPGSSVSCFNRVTMLACVPSSFVKCSYIRRSFNIILTSSVHIA